MDRLVDGVTLVFVFFLLLVFSESVPAEIQKIMIIPVAVFAFGMGFFANPGFFRKIFSPLARKVPWVYSRARVFFEEISAGTKAFSQSPKSTIVIWASSLIIWAIEAANFFIISRALGLEIGIIGIFLLVVIVALGSMIPSAPAYIGTFEALFVFGFLSMGLSAENGVAMAISLHAITFAVILVLGIFSLNFLGVSWKELAAGKKNNAKVG